MIHKPKERIYEYVSMDCYGYTIVCSCGKSITGWTTTEVETNYNKHQKVK